MLKKLLKQEFRATARLMLPLYLVTFVLALMVRLVLFWSQDPSLRLCGRRPAFFWSFFAPCFSRSG